MIPKEEREKDKAICEAATPGPWIHEGGRMVRCKPGGDTVPARTTEDAKFIVASRSRLPAYIADAEEMGRQIGQVERLIAEATPHDIAAEYYVRGLRDALRLLRGGQ